MIIRDITERKNAEEQLIIAKEKAEESDKLKTAFLQNMSHEIRTPMNAIMGFSDIILRNTHDNPKLGKYSKIISQRCEDLLSIINDILEISKIESGKLPVYPETFDVSELFEELKEFYTELNFKSKKENISFIINNPSGVPLFITSDKVKLKQIFINLISNAFKFTSAGSIECGFEWDEKKNPVFYVADTGIGISKEKFQFIFERFAQIESVKYGGTGLGLPIVKGLLKLLNGEIWLESEPGKGSKFRFFINQSNESLGPVA
jgi:signal transduction histidine kinase